MNATRTIAQQFYASVGIYTVAFSLPEPAKRVLLWANQYAKRYRFSDGSMAEVGNQTKGVALWCVSYGDTTREMIAVKLVNVLPQYRR